jgi:hypothetical protein
LDEAGLDGAAPRSFYSYRLGLSSVMLEFVCEEAGRGAKGAGSGERGAGSGEQGAERGERREMSGERREMSGERWHSAGVEKYL